MAALYVEQDSFNSSKRPTLDPYFLADLLVWPSFPGKAGLHCRLNAGDFLIINRDRLFADSNNLHHAWNHEDRHSIERIKPAKQIAWEQRLVDILDAIGPAPAGLVNRQKWLVAFTPQLKGDHVFMSASGLQREPRPEILTSSR